MLYKYNSEYYIKTARQFRKVNVEFKPDGSMIVKVVSGIKPIEDVYFNGETISKEKLKAELNKKSISKVEPKIEKKVSSPLKINKII